MPYSCCFSPGASQEVNSSFSRGCLAFFSASFAYFYTVRIFPGWAAVEGKEGRLWRYLLTKAGTLGWEGGLVWAGYISGSACFRKA